MTHSQHWTAELDPDVYCLAYYGVGDGTAAICTRLKDHPPVSVDGVGHSVDGEPSPAGPERAA